MAEHYVFKYPLQLTDVNHISMPKGAKLLHVGVQMDGPMLWALVDPNQPPAVRHIRVAGTGHPISFNEADHVLRHVGTFLVNAGTLVFHVFDFGEMALLPSDNKIPNVEAN